MIPAVVMRGEITHQIQSERIPIRVPTNHIFPQNQTSPSRLRPSLRRPTGSRMGVIPRENLMNPRKKKAPEAQGPKSLIVHDPTAAGNFQDTSTTQVIDHCQLIYLRRIITPSLIITGIITQTA